MKRFALTLFLFAVVMATTRDSNACTAGGQNIPFAGLDCNAADDYAIQAYVQNNSKKGLELKSDAITGFHGVDCQSANVITTDSGSYCFYGSMTGAANGIYQDVTNYSSAAVVGENLDTSDASGTRYGSGVFGSSTVPYGAGVYGRATSGSLTNGVFGKSSSSGASGVYSENSGGGYAVFGYTYSAGNSGGTGVYGYVGNGGSGTGGVGVYGNAQGAGSYGVEGNCSGTSCYAGYFSGNVHVTGNVSCGGSCGSDRTLKKNIEALTPADALAKVLALHGVTFEWKAPDAAIGQTSGRQVGVIAQDVEAVMPSWVHKNERGTLSVQPNEREELALLVESVRAVHEENLALRDEVKTLRGQHVTTAGFGAMPFALCVCCLAIILLAANNLRSMRRRA